MDVTNTRNGERGTDEEENVGKCEKCLGCKGEFLPAVLPDDSTFLLESSRVRWMVCSVTPTAAKLRTLNVCSIGPLCQVTLSGNSCSVYKSKINVLYLYLFCRQGGEHDLALSHRP